MINKEQGFMFKKDIINKNTASVNCLWQLLLVDNLSDIRCLVKNPVDVICLQKYTNTIYKWVELHRI